MSKHYRVTPTNSTGEIQEQINQLAPGDVLTFAAGTYRMALSIDLKGTAEAPITIEAETPGSVTITGADVISGWEPDGTLWKKPIDLSHLEPSLKHGELAGRKERPGP